MVDFIDLGNSYYLFLISFRNGKLDKNCHNLIFFDRTLLCLDELSCIVQQAHSKGLATLQNHAYSFFFWCFIFSWI